MAVANPTLLTAGGNQTAGASTVTASIAPSANSYVTVQVGVGQNPAVNITAPTDSWGDTGGGSWTLLGGATPANLIDYAVYRRLVGTGPSASVITLNADGSADRWIWSVVGTAGHDVAAPESEIAAVHSSTDDPFAVGTLGGVAPGNLVLAGCVVRMDASGQTVAIDADFTELVEGNTGTTPPVLHLRADYDANADEVDATYNPSGTTVQNFGLILEVAAAAPVPVAPSTATGFGGGSASGAQIVPIRFAVVELKPEPVIADFWAFMPSLERELTPVVLQIDVQFQSRIEAQPLGKILPLVPTPLIARTGARSPVLHKELAESRLSNEVAAMHRRVQDMEELRLLGIL